MSNDEKMKQAIGELSAALESGDGLLCGMGANKWQEETQLPMNIWIDEVQSYVNGGHPKRIRFQLDKSSKLNPRNFGSMDLNGGLHPSNLDIGELHTGDLTQLRNFVHNNRYALEHIADMEIWISQIWGYMIMGGERASDEAIAALNRKVDEIMANNKLKKEANEKLSEALEEAQEESAALEAALTKLEARIAELEDERAKLLDIIKLCD